MVWSKTSGSSALLCREDAWMTTRIFRYTVIDDRILARMAG